MLKITIICAFTKNRAIGKDGKIPWFIPEEMAHFKKTTIGGAVIFGMNTFLGINKVLPGRFNIVLSHSKKIKMEGLHVVSSFVQAIELCKKNGFTDIFICGGSEVYCSALEEKICTNMILSELDEKFLPLTKDADSFFPDFDKKEWTCTKKEKHSDFTVYFYSKL